MKHHRLSLLTSLAWRPELAASWLRNPRPLSEQKINQIILWQTRGRRAAHCCCEHWEEAAGEAGAGTGRYWPQTGEITFLDLMPANVCDPGWLN